MELPQYPAGPFDQPEDGSVQKRDTHIAELERAPDRLRGAVADLSEGQLDTRYKNWTVRQIVHHLGRQPREQLRAVQMGVDGGSADDQGV
ncbi:MAG: maleylpyruvate isomerase N-terminal domain-containing protein [Gammaproteobacteria bacterium]